MRSITKLDLQYAHRFYGFKGEAQYLHGHTGVLTIEVEDTVEPGDEYGLPLQRNPEDGMGCSEEFRPCSDSAGRRSAAARNSEGL